METPAADSLSLLRKIGETASAGGDLSGLFDQILDAITVAASVEVASIMLVDEDGALTIRAARGVPPEVVQTARISPGEGIAGYVFASGEPVLIGDLPGDGRFASSGGGHRYRNRSLLSVPIQIGGRVLGVINVNNRRGGEVFAEADRSLLTAISHLAALAVENAALAVRLGKQASELEAANERLRCVQETRSRLICNLSHELNTPLTSILGYLELLLSAPGGLKEEDAPLFLGRAFDESCRMERLISGMLRLFNLERSDEKWEQTAFSLDSLLRQALKAREGDILKRGMRLELGIADALPKISGDPGKTALLCSELLDNAIKFGRPGGLLSVQATVAGEAKSPAVYLRIYNDGEAVPPEAGDELFDGFTQLGDIYTGKPTGVGVGLATCRIIAERLQGKIFIEPAGGAGTAFGVLLPMAQEGRAA